MTDPENAPGRNSPSSRNAHDDNYRPCQIPRTSGRLRAVCWALVAVTLVLYVAGLPRGWRMGMDQAFYTSIARSVATGQGYTFIGKTQWSVPPATPLYLAAAYKFGHFLRPEMSLLETAVYLNAFMLVVGLAGILVAFFLLRELVFAAPPDSPRPAVVPPIARVIIATALLVFCSRYYNLSMETMSDAPYCLVSWAALLFLVRSLSAARQSDSPRRRWRLNLALAAFFLTLTPLVRIASLVLLGNVTALFILEARRDSSRRRSALAGLASLAPALVITAAMVTAIWLGRNEGTFNYLSGQRGTFGAASLGQVLRSWLLDWPSNLAQVPASLFGVFSGRSSATLPGLVVFAVVAIGAACSWRRGQSFPVFYCVSSLAIVSATTAPQTRYFLPLLPFIFLFAVDGTLTVGGWAASAVSRLARGAKIAFVARALPAAAVIALVAVTVASNSSPIRRSISLNFARDFYRQYRKGDYYHYLALTRALASNPPQGVVMAREFRVIFALSSVPACPALAVRPGAAFNIDEAAQYVRDRSVTVIVMDPRQADSAIPFTEFIARGPFQWYVTATFGNLTVYSRVP